MANAEQLKTLGRYNIERVLGKGAMGVVYEGVDPRLGRRVAIKTILKSALDEDTGKDFAMRFVREAQAVARLNHPNVVQVFDFGEEGDCAYIVMEFIRGKELKNFFDANERFDLKEAVRIMCELCDALEFAHEAGIIHRDIKPANVMLDSQGRTKLTDFGVARVQDNDKTSVEKTQAGTMVGTPAYMSPEQITGGNIDRRTDIFSAGIILYQFLTGEKPFTGSGAWTIAKKIIQEDPPLPSSLNNAITPVFDAVVNKALAKNVDERFQTARDLGTALKRALEGKGTEDESDKTVVGGGMIDLDATMKGPVPTMPSPAAAAKSPTATASAGTQQGSQEVELEFWRAIKDGNDPDDFELYVQQFPNGIYAALAKRKIAKLKGFANPEDSAKAKEQEKKEADDAARKEQEARTKLAEEKEKLELELAQREEEYKRREAEREAQRAAEEQARQEAIEKAKLEAAAERERAKQEAAAEREKAKQEAAATLAAEREKAKQEAEKAKLEAVAERERARKEAAAEAEKARLEAEKSKKEAEERARAEAEQARKEAAAERERAKLEAEKAKKEAEALAKTQAEERAKREAEFKKREAELKAQAAAGGKKASPVVAIAVGLVVLAISGTGYYFFAPDDKAAQEQLKAMQAELKKAQDAQEQARLALDKAKEAEEKARREGDVAKMKELAEQRARAETEAKKTADAAKAREADAEKGKESAKVTKEKQDKDKLAAEQKAKEDKAKADKLAADKAAADRASMDAATREKAAADKALADARAAAEKARAEADKATAEARATAEKAKADAEKARQEAAAAQAKIASAAPAAPGGASAAFEQGAALEREGKGAEAVRVYVKAARGGSGPAAKRLGEIYDKGIDGVSRDYAESLKWRNAARVLGEEVPTAKSRN